MEIDVLTLTGVSLTFLLAGLVKGVIGLGLPTVCLAVLTILFDLTTAMALLLIPSFLTNLWQAMSGDSLQLLLRRLWPMLIPAVVSIWFGTVLLTRVDTHWLSALLGLLLVIYATVSLSGWQWCVTKEKQKTTGFLIGTVNGFLTGMTGSFVVPGVMYLQAIQLSRDQLIQAMGVLFTLSTLSLAIGLHTSGLLNVKLGIYSTIGLLPALIGMLLGQQVRRRLPEVVFRRLFFGSLFFSGVYIVFCAI
ncbi:MAG: sulfite exporter TauE/SafE family protein [Pseudomonadota bacterium]